METNQTPDFGEPWREQTVSFMPGTIEDRDGKVVSSREQKLRAIECVAACAGMADPAKQIQAMRDALQSIESDARDLRKFKKFPESVEALACSILLKLQPHLPVKL